MSVVVFSNMNSGMNLRDRLRIKGLRNIVKKEGEVFATKSLEHLERRVEDLHQKYHPKSVILDTGDGGVCKFVGLLKKHWPETEELPSIGLLPGGTFNVLARQCGVKRKKGKVKEYIESIIKGEGIYMQDIGFMRVTDSNCIESYGFSFGIGAVVTLLDEVYKRKRWRWARATIVLGRLRFSKIFREQYYTLFNQKTGLAVAAGAGGEEKRYDDDYLVLMAQTIKSIGLRGSETFYKAQEQAGHFHARGITCELAEVMRLAVMAKIYSGSPFGRLDVQASALRISSEKPFRYQVNGELDHRDNGDALPYLANEINVRHGLTLKIIKTAR